MNSDELPGPARRQRGDVEVACKVFFPHGGQQVDQWRGFPFERPSFRAAARNRHFFRQIHVGQLLHPADVNLPVRAGPEKISSNIFRACWLPWLCASRHRRMASTKLAGCPSPRWLRCARASVSRASCDSVVPWGLRTASVSKTTSATAAGDRGAAARNHTCASSLRWAPRLSRPRG